MAIRLRLQFLQFFSMIFIYGHVFIPAAVLALEGEEDSKSSYFLLKTSHVREGKANITKQVADELSCKRLCLRDPKCYTVNFEKTPRKGFHLCQIFHFEGIGVELPSQQFDVFTPMPKTDVQSCTHAMSLGYNESAHYVIDPDGRFGKLRPFWVYCNMSSHAGIGVTVITHNSEQRTLVDGFEESGSYRRDVVYDGISDMDQLRALASISNHCEQFIKYECYHSLIKSGKVDFAWLVSYDGRPLNYWGGASRDSQNCACGMTKSCDNTNKACNCDANDKSWREDSGMLSYKEDLPIISLRFGDTGWNNEQGYHTLGSLRCYGMAD